MKSEKLQFDRSLATDSEATYRLRTKSRRSLDAGIGGTFYSIPVDSYRNFRRILLYAAMRTISNEVARVWHQYANLVFSIHWDFKRLHDLLGRI